MMAGAVLALLVLAPGSGFGKDNKKDPKAIGDRDVGKGVNFYSIEKEIGVGKQLAQDVERPGQTRRRSSDSGVCEPHRSNSRPELRRQSTIRKLRCSIRKK
jgi:hypothetical protein